MKKVTVILTQNECDKLAGKPNANGRDVERKLLKLIEKELNTQERK